MYRLSKRDNALRNYHLQIGLISDNDEFPIYHSMFESVWKPFYYRHVQWIIYKFFRSIGKMYLLKP